MSYTVDPTTTASQPGEIMISKNKYLDYVGLTGLKRFVYDALFSLPQNYLFKHFRSNTYVYDYISKTEHFALGCANPMLVLDKSENLVATYTNLTFAGEEATPVIKISREPLNLIKNTEIKNGQRLPSVALYYRHAEEDEDSYAWADFDPKIANCFTDDLEACNLLLSKIRKNSWTCLDLGLAQIQDQSQEGLHHVDLDTKLVYDSF